MEESMPALPLPLLDSIMSGAWSELRNWLLFCAIWAKDFTSNLTLTPVFLVKSAAASFQAMV